MPEKQAGDKGKLQFLKQMLQFSAATWIGAALTFLVTPIVTRTFVPEELGKVNMFITYSSLLEYVAMMGMNQGYVRYYNEPPGRLSRSSLFKLCVFMPWAFTALLCLVVLLLGNTLSVTISGVPGLLVPISLCVYMSAKVFLTMSNTAHRMQQKAFRYSIQALAVNLAIKVSYAFAAIGGATHLKAIQYITGTVFFLFAVYLFLQRRDLSSSLAGIGVAEIRPLLRYSLPLIPVTFMAYLNAALPKLMLQRWSGFTEIGIYSAALTLVNIIALVQAGFNISWAPYVYKNYTNKPGSIRKVHRMITLVMVAVGLLIILFQDGIYLLLGTAYRSSRGFMPLMLVSPVLYTIAETTGLGINIAKKTYLNIVTYALTIAVNVGVGMAAIPRWGNAGAAAAVAAAAWVMFLSKTMIGEKYYQVVASYSQSLLPPGLMTLSAALNLYLVDARAPRIVLNLLFLALIARIYIVEVRDLLGIAQILLNKLRKGRRR